MTGRWDPTSVKALLRLTSQRLGTIQERKDSHASITRRDIATLLGQGNTGLARLKAQNLIQEDASGDLLEVLQLYLSVLLEHFSELDQEYVNTPAVVEAASSIIYAGASLPESKELPSVRALLIQRLGDDFARSAVSNRDNHVPARVVHALSAAPPTAGNLDMYLYNIARSYGVSWFPDPRRQDILNPLSEILNPETPVVVDLPRLRHLCIRGLPDEPPWLRPRIWRLFLGTLPTLKSSWRRDSQQQRDSYYDLVRRLLKPFCDQPPPQTTLTQLDSSLLAVSNQLSRTPARLFEGLIQDPEHVGTCPLDEGCAEEIKIPYANILDTRLKAILDRDDQPEPGESNIPEIRLEIEEAPEEQEPSSLSQSISGRRPSVPHTLVLSGPRSFGGAHPKHLSALLRILYIHSVINPASHSSHLPGMLLPLYMVLGQEIEAEDLNHVEADAFWLFEALVGEFSELEDDEGTSLWMKKFSDRVLWADSELAETLVAKGLDPSLPHFSYRWLAPILSQTLPLPAILVIWDSLFSRPMRERDQSYKAEYLLDVCAALLIRARGILFRLGKSGHKSASLWGEESATIPPPSPLRAREFGDAFMEGMSLLQDYPIEAAGGIDRLMQTAADLLHRRETEQRQIKPDSLTLSARFRQTMWRGFTNQMPSPDVSPPESEDTREEETSSSNQTTEAEEMGTGITARLASTVWRGITNQSSMEPPPTPMSPMVPSPLPSPIGSPWHSTKEAEPARDSATTATTSLWNYAEKLKDSDTVAALAKASSNWRAKAMLTSWTSPQRSPASPTQQSTHLNPEVGSSMSAEPSYSPPQRPSFFRPPRDSFMGPAPPAPAPSSPPGTPPWSPQSDGGLFGRARNLQETLSALTRPQSPPLAAPPPPPKSGPKPLLLSSSTLMTAHPRRESSDGTSQWQHVPRGKVHHLHRDSQSSASSLSPGWKGNGSVDLGGRVALNRRSISPMAPISRIRPTSQGSSASTSPERLASPPGPTTPIISEHLSTAPNVLGLSLQVDDTTDSEAAPPPVSPRIRSKRYASRPSNIKTEDLSRPNLMVVDRLDDITEATTPKAATFEADTDGLNGAGTLMRGGRRKSSTGDTVDNQDGSRTRKNSGRTRKVSTGTIKASRSQRDSVANEGDVEDEGGLDEFLSAYESEDGAIE